MKKEIQTFKDSGIFIKDGEKVIGVIYLDQKTHHNVFYKMDTMSGEEISELLNETVQL